MKGVSGGLGRSKGSAIPPWIPSILFFSVLDRLCFAPYLGERSRTGLQLVIWRDLPHTYFCTCLYSKEKTRVETRRDSAGVEHRGV